MLEQGELPAGRQDQRDCCGCHRKQRDHAGGLSPTCSGRPPDLSDQTPQRVASFITDFGVHTYLLPFALAPNCPNLPLAFWLRLQSCVVGRSDSLLVDSPNRPTELSKGLWTG
jgi:hypothetical protein